MTNKTAAEGGENQEAATLLALHRSAHELAVERIDGGIRIQDRAGSSVTAIGRVVFLTIHPSRGGFRDTETKIENGVLAAFVEDFAMAIENAQRTDPDLGTGG